MTIIYPIAAPTVRGPSSISLTPNDVVAVAVSPFTGSQQAQRHQGQWWILTADYSSLTKSQTDLWFAFLTRLKWRYGTFTFGDPTKATPSGVATGTPVVNGSSQSGDYLNTRGWTPNVTGILKAGDYIQIGTGSSTTLYRLTADASSDGSGNASLEIWPQIRQNASIPTDGATVITANCVGQFRLDQPAAVKITPGPFGSVSIAAREAL